MTTTQLRPSFSGTHTFSFVPLQDRKKNSDYFFYLLSSMPHEQTLEAVRGTGVDTLELSAPIRSKENKMKPEVTTWSLSGPRGFIMIDAKHTLPLAGRRQKVTLTTSTLPLQWNVGVDKALKAILTNIQQRSQHKTGFQYDFKP